MTELFVLTAFENGQFWGAFTRPELAMGFVYTSYIYQRYRGYSVSKVAPATAIPELDWYEDEIGGWLAFPKGVPPYRERTWKTPAEIALPPKFQIRKHTVDMPYPDDGSMMQWAALVGIGPMDHYFKRYPARA